MNNYYVKGSKSALQHSHRSITFNHSTRDQHSNLYASTLITTKSTIKYPTIIAKESSREATRSLGTRYYDPMSCRKRNNIKYGNMFSVYQRTKQCVGEGHLTSRRLVKLLKPREYKHLQEPTMDVGNASVNTLEQKVKFANYVLNAKESVRVKNENVTQILKRYQEHYTERNQSLHNNISFLANLKTIFLRKKKMKQQLEEHLVDREEMMNSITGCIK